MLKLLRFAAPVAFGVAVLPTSLCSQTGHVASGGTLSVSIAADVNRIFKQQNIDVTYIGTGPIRRGENFDVTGGKVDLSNDTGNTTSLGAMTFTEGDNTVTLNQFELEDRSRRSHITANVVVNGSAQGRYPVFLLESGLYNECTSYGPYRSGPVKFTINPEFRSEFADYIPVNGLDPDTPLGVFALDVTITRKK